MSNRNTLKPWRSLRWARGGTVRARMVRGASGVLVLKVVSTVLVFAAGVLLARILGAEEYGVYAYAMSWISILLVPAGFGLPVLLTRQVARYQTQEDLGSLRGITRWSRRVAVTASVVLALLVAGLVWVLKGELGSPVSLAIWVALPILPFLGLVHVQEGTLRGLGQAVLAQTPQLLVLPLLFILLVGGFHLALDLSAQTALLLRSMAAGSACFVGFLLCRRHFPESARQAEAEYKAREWLSGAFPLLLIAVGQVINAQIGIVMVGSLLDSEAAGVFTVVRRGATFVTFAMVAVNMPLAPIIASLHAQGDMTRLQRVVTKSARIILFGSLPVALGLIAFGHWVLLIFGQEFIVGRAALTISALGMLVAASMGPGEYLLNMTGHQWDAAKAALLSVIANVALGVILIPIWDIEGAAIASATGIIIWRVTLAGWVLKRLAIHPTALGDILRRRRP